MTKVFCDACGTDEIEGGHKLQVACHILENTPLHRAYVARIGDAAIPVSGRMETIDLCPVCYNIVLGEAVAAYKRIKEDQANLKFVRT